MSNELEKYLHSVAHELRYLPRHKREENLREIRVHLETIIAHRIEAGEDAEEATTVAISQFGTARQVGRRLMRASLKAESLVRVVVAPLCGVLGQVVLMGVVVGGMHLMDRPLGFLPDGVLNGYPNHPLMSALYALLMRCTSVGNGMIVGRIAPRSALWSAPLLTAFLGVASSGAFPFEVLPIVLLQKVAEVFIGAWIGSRSASRRHEHA